MLYLTYQDVPFTGAQFRRLLRLCFRHADSFSLGERRSVPSFLELGQNLQSALRPYLLRYFETRRWFDTPRMNPPKHIFLYRADPDALPILELYGHHLSGMGYRVPEENLEDLCFFSGDTLFFGTLSCDGFCGVYPPTEGFSRELVSIRDDWRHSAREKDPLSLRHFR